MTGRNLWPFRGDSPTVVARKVAAAYRAALEDVAPDACRALDARMTGWGQTWAVPRIRYYDADDMLTAAEAADVGHVGRNTIGAWRRRGRLPGFRQTDGSWLYRAGDVEAMSGVRHRNTMGHVTVTGDRETL